MSADQFKQYLAQESRFAQNRQLATEQAERRRKEMIAARTAEDNVLFKHLADYDEVLPFRNPLRITIPTGPLESVVLSDERRDAHVEHLRAIISATFSAPLKMPSKDNTTSVAPPDSLTQRICTMCRGGCCLGGGDFAFLSVLTIRRIRAANPDIDASALLDQYLSRLPTESMENSCVYHTTEGCALPRELRSDTCNEYVCVPLEKLQQQSQSSDWQNAVVAIQRRHGDTAQQHGTDLDTVITGAALITETTTIPLNLPSAAASPATS